MYGISQLSCLKLLPKLMKIHYLHYSVLALSQWAVMNLGCHDITEDYFVLTF